MISRQKRVGLFLLVAALSVGIGCNKQDQDKGQAGPPPSPPPKPLTNSDFNVAISDANGVCYTDQNWVVTDASKTISWTSTTKTQYIVEFSTPSPITDSTGASVPAVQVLSSGSPAASYTINKPAACSATTISGCFAPYTIVKVSSNPTGNGQFCGPSPMTVGIHIKP